MSYGWAIVVILAVGVLLWYLGVFGGGETKTPTASGFIGIKPLESSIQMNADCSFFGIFLNGRSSAIEITDIVIYNMGDDHDCPTKTLGVGNYSAGKEVEIRQSSCCSQNHIAGDSYVLQITISYTEIVAGNPVTRTDVGKIYGYYVEQFQLMTCAEQGGTCCTPPDNACNPGTQLAASDCSPCCQAPGDCKFVATTTTTTTTTTTSATTTSTTTTSSTSSTTTTTLAETISGAIICGSIYECGSSDSVCPEDFSSYGCDTPDPDC